jgi:capsular exopolysaccharide synthesis family protein
VAGELPALNGARPASARQLSLFEAVRRRRLMTFGTPLAVVALTILFVLWVPPLFQSSTLIRIDEEKSGVAVLQALQTLSSQGSELQTEMAVLRSRSLAEEVARETALQLTLVEPSRTRRSEIFSLIRADTTALEALYTLERAAPGRYRVSAVFELPKDAVRPFTRARREARELGELSIGVPAALEGVTVTLTPAAGDHERIVMHLATFPDAVSDLQKALVVARPDREANVVQVIYQNTDAELAQTVLNVHARHFIEGRQGVQSAEARGTVDFLDEQLGALTLQLTEAEENLRDFSAANRVVSPEEEAAGQVQLLVEMKAKRDVMETERASLAGLMAEIRAEAADTRPVEGSGRAPVSPYRRLFAFPSLFTSAVTGELLSQLAALENEVTEKLARLEPADRDIQLLLERIGFLETQLQSISETYLGSLDSQVASYDGALAGFQGELSRIPAAQMMYFRLRREAQVFSELYTLLQTRRKEAEIAAAVQDLSVRVVDPAPYPRVPVRPRPALSLFMAVAVGMLLGVGGAVAAEHRDRSVRDRRDLGRVTGAAVLGSIPELRATAPRTGNRLPVPWFSNGRHLRPHLVSRITAGDPAVEAYRSLRTNLLFSRIDQPPRVVVFTSPMPGDGKSTTAVNLAAVLAQQGHRILLVDADMRRGLLHEVLKTPREPGLSEVLFGKASLSEAVSAVEPGEGSKLDFLPSGIWPPNPAELVASPRMREMLETARGEYEMVILDAPQLNLVTDAAVLGTQCDGVILVARAGVTEEAPLEYAVEQLASVRAPLLGTVLNGVEEARQDYYGSQHGRARAYLRGS